MSQILFSDNRSCVIRVVLSNNSKEFFNEFCLRHTIALTDSVNLPFANHTHGFNAPQSNPCRGHWLGNPLHVSMILLNQIVQILVLP